LVSVSSDFNIIFPQNLRVVPPLLCIYFRGGDSVSLVLTATKLFLHPQLECIQVLGPPQEAAHQFRAGF
jgi:hypothetical protein